MSLTKPAIEFGDCHHFSFREGNSDLLPRLKKVDVRARQCELFRETPFSFSEESTGALIIF
jgi:hypothetical protein